MIKHTVKHISVLPAIFMLLLFLSAPNAPVFATDNDNPEEAIDRFNAALLESMKKAGDLGYAGRYKLLSPVNIGGEPACPDPGPVCTGYE